MPTPTSSSWATYVSLSGDPIVDSLIYGTKWLSPVVTYSFPSGTAYFLKNYADPTIWNQWGPLSATQQTQATNALFEWQHVANITFLQSADTSTVVGDIRVTFSASKLWGNSAASAYAPLTTPEAGDVWLNPDANDFGTNFFNSSFQPGSYGYFTLIHEFGHAIGLKHPFEASPYNSTTLPTDIDSIIFSVMSYTNIPNHPDVVGFSFYPTTPMVFDIAAIQAIYGENNVYNAGDTVYQFNDLPNQYYFETIWDAGGNNTIYYTGNSNAEIDLHQGHGSYIGNPIYAETATNLQAYTVKNVWIAVGTHINNLTISGYGNDVVTANDDDCTIHCGGGNDTIITGAGNDLIDGGSGNDAVNFSGKRSDYTFGASNSGFLVKSISNGAIDTLTAVEHLHFSDSDVTLALGVKTNDTEAEAYRLYKAAFDRTPDLAGLGYWIKQMDNGTTLKTVAQGFIGSTEFQAMYGSNSTDATFVRLLYNHVLARDPDQGGYDYWLNEMTHGMSRDLVLTNFSDSTENINNVAQVIAVGIPYIEFVG